jgi:hypothetical protein
MPPPAGRGRHARHRDHPLGAFIGRMARGRGRGGRGDVLKELSLASPFSVFRPRFEDKVLSPLLCVAGGVGLRMKKRVAKEPLCLSDDFEEVL